MSLMQRSHSLIGRYTEQLPTKLGEPLYRIHTALYHSFGEPRKALDRVVETMAIVLNETEAVSRNLALESFTMAWRRRQEQHFVNKASAKELVSRFPSVRYEGPQFFKQYGEIVSDYCGERPMVLTGVHLGPYPISMRILADHAPTRDVTILRRQIGSTAQVGSYQRSEREGVSMNVVSMEEGGAGLGAFRALRAGHTLVVFFDTPRAWGAQEVVEMSFFDRECFFSSATAKLAIMGRAAILPFFTATDSGRLIIRFEKPIDCHGMTLEQVREVTQQLVDLLELWLRRYPSQWSLWRYLPTMWKGSEKQPSYPLPAWLT